LGTQGIKIKPFNEDQQRILDQIRATFDYMPDGEEAEVLRNWLAFQLDTFLTTLTYEDLNMSELMAAVGTLGPAFSRVPPERQPALAEPLSLRHLKAV
jgi:hypothetical protein